MKNLFIAIVIIVFGICFTLSANSQTPYQTGVQTYENETRTLQVVSANCKFAKGKILGQTIRIDVATDGFEDSFPLKKKLKSGRSWNIYYNYDFLEFVTIRVWDDNVFNDVLLAEFTVDKNSIDQFKTININNEKVVMDLTYKVMPGPGYKAIIDRLRQSLVQAKLELKHLRKENESLSDEVDRLRDRNDDLLDDIRDLKK